MHYADSLIRVRSELKLQHYLPWLQVDSLTWRKWPSELSSRVAQLAS